MTSPHDEDRLYVRYADTADLGDALIAAAYAHGDVGKMAAVVLLTHTGPDRLLARPDVRAMLVSGRPGRVHVDWERLDAALDEGTTFGSPENQCVLTVCVALAIGDLGRALPHLADADLVPVVRAIATAAAGAAAVPASWPPPIPDPDTNGATALLADAPPIMMAVGVATGFGLTPQDQPSGGATRHP